MSASYRSLPPIRFKRIDQMTLIEAERSRLERALLDEPQKGEGIWRWMVDWLAKTDEEHLANGDAINQCDMCHARPRFILTTEFSFCEEYDCGIDLCDKCILELADVVRASAANRQSK